PETPSVLGNRSVQAREEQHGQHGSVDEVRRQQHLHVTLDQQGRRRELEGPDGGAGTAVPELEEVREKTQTRNQPPRGNEQRCTASQKQALQRRAIPAISQYVPQDQRYEA